MTYKDMTFCDYYKDCENGKDCPRALTKQVIEGANKWMENAPICSFSAKPDCHQCKICHARGYHKEQCKRSKK